MGKSLPSLESAGNRVAGERHFLLQRSEPYPNLTTSRKQYTQYSWRGGSNIYFLGTAYTGNIYFLSKEGEPANGFVLKEDWGLGNQPSDIK